MNMIKIEGGTGLYKSAIPVENFPGVLSYICEDFKRSIRLTRTIKDELVTLFGKQNQTVRAEFYYRIWYIKTAGEIFTISTANDKGTSFGIVANIEDSKSDICIKFLNEIDELIQNINK